MGNRITNRQVDAESNLDMRNTTTSVFVNLLALSASRLAASAKEILWATWLASRDQYVFGVGGVGFDISEMPWSLDEAAFEQEKQFLRTVIREAVSQRDWHRLSYTPDPERAIPNQLQFLEMIEQFKLRHVQQHSAANDFEPGFELSARCPQHGVLLHELGCVVCNEERHLL